MTQTVEASSGETERRAGGAASDRRVAWKHLLGILLVALIARIVCLERSTLVGADSTSFLAQARAFERGDRDAALGYHFHPLTAWLIAEINLVQQRFTGPPRTSSEDRILRERAGYLLVIPAGLAVVWLMLELTRRLFPTVPPAAVGWLAALQPYFVRYSADIMSEMLFLALLLIALALAVIAARAKHPFAAAGSGVAAGLSYLVRPEGLLLAPVLAIYWFIGGGRRFAWTGARLVCFFGPALVIMLPYIEVVSERSGLPTITNKKDLYELLGLRPQESSAVAAVEPAGASTVPSPPAVGTAASPVEPERRTALLVLGSAVKIVNHWFVTSHEAIATFFLIGIWLVARHRRWGMGHTLYFLLAAAVCLVLIRLLVVQKDPNYLSRRHVFTLVALTLPVAVEGVLAVGGAFGAWLSRRPGVTIDPRRGSTALLALVLCVTGAKAVAPQRIEQLAQLEVARWIGAEYGEGEIVYTDREKVPYYANGRWEPLTGSAEEILAQVRGRDRAWVVFYRERLDCRGLLADLDATASGFRLMRSLQDREGRRVYNLLVYLWEKPR